MRLLPWFSGFSLCSAAFALAVVPTTRVLPWLPVIVDMRPTSGTSPDTGRVLIRPRGSGAELVFVDFAPHCMVRVARGFVQLRGDTLVTRLYDRDYKSHARRSVTCPGELIVVEYHLRLPARLPRPRVFRREHGDPLGGWEASPSPPRTIESAAA